MAHSSGPEGCIGSSALLLGCSKSSHEIDNECIGTTVNSRSGEVHDAGNLETHQLPSRH